MTGNGKTNGQSRAAGAQASTPAGKGGTRRMVTLDQLLEQVRDLPPLPDVVVRLLQASRDPSTSMRDMVELIRIEPALTAKVLKLCNSSYYGLPRRINSLQEALVYIGTDTLVNFILAGSLSVYYRQAQEGYGLAAGELWRHSVGCALAAQRLAEGQGEAELAEAFTAGLLHDIGKLALNAYVAEEFATIYQIVKDRKVPFEEAEREILGFSHCDAGAEIGKMWNLPDSLIEAIACHQDPTAAKKYPDLVARIHLANLLCVSFGIGLGNDGLAYMFHPAAMERLGIEVPDLYRLSLDVHDQLHRAEELVGLSSVAA